MDAWEQRMPKDLQANIDFVSNMGIVVLAFVLRKIGVVRAEHLPGMQLLAFTFGLPAVVFGVTWSVTIDATLISIFLAAVLTHTLWALAVSVTVRCMDIKHRGLYSMAMTAGSMAFVYPQITRSARFGHQSAAIVVMWELGGNMAIATIFYGISASAYAPVPAAETEGASLAEDAARAATVRARANAPQPTVLPVVVGMPAELPDERGGGLSSRSGFASDVAAGLMHCRQGAGPVLRNPVIYAAFAGLALNAMGVPVYPLPARSVQALGSSFPPLLYAFLGANLRFDLSRDAYGTVMRVLFARWVACVPVALFIWYALPLSSESRGVFVLCVAAPIASSFCMYASKYGYQMDQCAMIYNLCCIASLIVMALLIEIV